MNANLLRAAIAERGMNQARLADAIGISSNSLSRKMTGKREFSVAEASAIARVLRLENPQRIFFDSNVPDTQQVEP